MLIHTESGHVVPEMCEELTSHRRARKAFRLTASAANAPSTLFVLARRHAGFRGRLRVTINGREMSGGAAADRTTLQWLRFPVPAGALKQGSNRVDLHAVSEAQDAWALAFEGGHENPQSFLSSDAGRTWQNARMGSQHVQRGEYVVRLRVDTPVTKSRPIPAFTWERPDAPRLSDLARVLPRSLQSLDDPWRKARAVASWTSRQWRYANTNDGATLYCPWDPWTILASPNARARGAVVKPVMIRMCVQYGVLFTCLCLALGIPARAAICTDSLAGMNGHFVTEVWLEQHNRWVMIDPNLDLAFVDGGRPLGIEELYPRRRDLHRLAQTGAGTEFHRPRLGTFLDEQVLTGKSFRLSGVWCRNDFLSRPDLTPPAHGQEAFSETDIVWRSRNIRGDELGMFPFVAPDAWFDEPPRARISNRSNNGTGRDQQTV